MWGAGLAGFAALVGSWKVARSGYLRLVATIIAGISVVALLAGAPTIAAGGAVSAGIATWKNDRPVAYAGLAGAAVFLLIAGREIGWISLAVGAMSLGAISSELILGHWFLVDPKLPRWPLRRLAIAGVVGALAEASFVGGQSDLIAPTSLLVGMAVFASILMVGVVLALRVKSYTGVMAATGLSYLATLVALSVAIIARPA